MKKILIIILAVTAAIVGAIVFFSNNASQEHPAATTTDELYEMMAEDCVAFRSKGRYVIKEDISAISREELSAAIKEKDVVMDGVMYGYTYKIAKNRDSCTLNIEYKYLITQGQYRKVCKMAKKIANEMRGFTDYEKIKATHDYLIEYNNYHIGSDGPYRALYKGQTNCNGYTLAFMAIMRECNIPCTYETGDRHAWSMVKLEEQWYNIDVTWDDTGVYDKEGGILYKYFLKSDADWLGHHHGGATAKESYPADLTVKKHIPNQATKYRITITIEIVAVILLAIGIRIAIKKIKKRRTNNGQMASLQNAPNENSSILMTEYDDIVSGE